MKNGIKLVLTLLILSSCAMKESQNNKLIEGYKWTAEKKGDVGFCSGDSYSFLPNDIFEAHSWYSGGAYWIHHFSGRCHYNVEQKTIYLKYKKSPYLIGSLKKQIQFQITEKDTVFTVYDTWGKPNTVKQNINLEIAPSILKKYGTTTFKIEALINKTVER